MQQIKLDTDCSKRLDGIFVNVRRDPGPLSLLGADEAIDQCMSLDTDPVKLRIDFDPVGDIALDGASSERFAGLG